MSPLRASDFSHWYRRWVRSPEPRNSPRYHIGEPNLALSMRRDELMISAYCGLAIRGNKEAASMAAAFEACPRDCDESLHCRQCAKSLARQQAGRKA